MRYARGVERVAIERHRPERGARGAAVAPAGQCCCCCCCCLHSLGGVIGAATARSKAVREEVPAAAIGGATREPKPSASRLYWMIVLFVSAFVAVWNLGIERHPDQMDAVFIIVLVLPAIQLASSIIAAIVIAVSKRPAKGERLRHLASITLRAFIGALLGTLAMLPMFKC
jgi:hypothetical protein